MKNIINVKTGVLAGMILTISLWRIAFPGNTMPWANFTPIGAIALFGGCYFSDKWKAYLVPLAALWLTDIVLNYRYSHELVLLYSGFYWTYGAFAAMVLLGSFIKKVSVGNITLACIGAALLHFIITNFGVWVSGTMYPANWEGFTACYLAAIPFLERLLASNLMFAALMFGAFEWSKNRFPALQASQA